MPERTPRIARTTIVDIEWEMAEAGWEETCEFDFVYRPGRTARIREQIFRVETDDGVVGEAPGPADERSARYLLGRDPLARERAWQDLKRGSRGELNAPPGAVDVALWDLAGRILDVPVHQLLGGAWRLTVPCYASTFHGDNAGGLSTPDDYAAFAVACRDHGYRGFKVHGWVNGPVDREVQTVLAVREAVGAGMDLMCDPAGGLRTFVDALRVARACDAAEYLWLEDPLPGPSISVRAHAALKGLGIRTPLLVGEHMRGLETRADAISQGAVDLVRAGYWEDGGITGVMKLAVLAEAHGLDVELHGNGLAHRHCLAVLRNANYYESFLLHPRIPDGQAKLYRDERWNDLPSSVGSGGEVAVPTGAGLGAELDWDWIDDHTVRRTVFP